MLSTCNTLSVFFRDHPIGTALLAFAILSSVIQDVMFRRYSARVVTITKWFWAIIGSVADFLPPFLWNLVFLWACGLRVGTALLVLPVLLMINSALRIYVDILIAKIGNRFVRTITLIVGVLALLIEWRVFPGMQLALPYKEFLEKTISVLPTLTLRVVSLLLLGEVVACCLLLMYPRRFVETKTNGGTAVIAVDQEVLQRLEKVLSILPQGGWLARQLLRIQAFFLGALDKHFFGGGALLENTMNAFLGAIHAIHVFVSGQLQKLRAAR